LGELYAGNLAAALGAAAADLLDVQEAERQKAALAPSDDPERFLAAMAATAMFGVFAIEAGLSKRVPFV
jgi:hypothetical protein